MEQLLPNLSSPQDRGQITDLREVGATGLRRFSGFVYDEFLPELIGWRGAAIYKEMAYNEPVISSILFAISMLCRQVQFHSEPASQAKEDLEAADFLDSCMNDMDQPWTDTLVEILSMITYGYSPHEIVYKRRCGDVFDPSMRSKYKDGRVGWRKWPIRSQDTIYRWQFDDHGEIQGVEQLAPPHYYHTTIPIEKLLLFRTTPIRNNPEGLALDPSTPIITPNGWRLLGELKIGDQLFDEKGMIRHVTATAEWDSRPRYKITFNNGTSIIADAKHQWVTQNQYQRINKILGEIRNTEEIASTVKVQGDVSNHSIVFTKPLQNINQYLPLPAYFLGLWLGDGTSRNSDIACHEDDAEETKKELENFGFKVRITHSGPEGCKGRSLKVQGEEAFSKLGPQALLRSMDLINNKHIPEAYLRGSIEQRTELLQGLLDSDAHIDSFGRIEFSNINKNLINGVNELARSLGLNPRATFRKEELTGKNKRSKLYCIRFTPPSHIVPFRLKRKAAKIGKQVHRQNHYIVSVEPIKKGRTVCIEVDSPSHLFLAGEAMIPTHNSCLRGAYRHWYMMKNIENIEAIGVERDLAGLPCAWVPPEILSQNASPGEKAILAQITQSTINVRRNQQEGMIMPLDYDQVSGKQRYDFKLLSTGGSRQFNTTEIINRYAHRISINLLGDFLLIGQQSVGSFALVTSKTDLFTTAIGAFLDMICSIINRFAVPRLFQLNDFRISKYPEFKRGRVGNVNLDDLSDYINKLTGSGMQIFPTITGDLERYLLDVAKVPSEGVGTPPPGPTEGKNKEDLLPNNEGKTQEFIPNSPLQIPNGSVNDRTPADGQPKPEQVVTNITGNTEMTSRAPNPQDEEQYSKL